MPTDQAGSSTKAFARRGVVANSARSGTTAFDFPLASFVVGLEAAALAWFLWTYDPHIQAQLPTEPIFVEHYVAPQAWASWYLPPLLCWAIVGAGHYALLARRSTLATSQNLQFGGVAAIAVYFIDLLYSDFRCLLLLADDMTVKSAIEGFALIAMPAAFEDTLLSLRSGFIWIVLFALVSWCTTRLLIHPTTEAIASLDQTRSDSKTLGRSGSRLKAEQPSTTAFKFPLASFVVGMESAALAWFLWTRDLHIPLELPAVPLFAEHYIPLQGWAPWYLAPLLCWIVVGTGHYALLARNSILRASPNLRFGGFACIAVYFIDHLCSDFGYIWIYAVDMNVTRTFVGFTQIALPAAFEDTGASVVLSGFRWVVIFAVVSWLTTLLLMPASRQDRGRGGNA